MHDRIIAWFCLGLAVLIGILGYQLGVGALEKPGPGFLPVIAAGFIALFSLLLLLRNVPSGGEKKIFQGIFWHRIILTLLLLFIYSFILPRVGYLLSTFLVMTVLFRLIRKVPWGYVILWGAVSSLASFLIFNTWLEVTLPAGFLGF